VCIQNPASGRETQIPQLVSKSDDQKKAIVVGGGPAGLEAARVLAERGHRVVLFEAQDRVGGQVVLAARASERQAELLGVIGWLEQELDHLDVDVRLNTLVESDDITGEQPDIVIVASGGFPDTSFLTAGQNLVNTSWDVLGGHAAVEGTVLIYDDHGGEHAPSVAEYLAARDVTDIELVTPDRMVAQDLAATTGPQYLRMLYENDVTMTPDHNLVGVQRAGSRLVATLRNVFTRTEQSRTVDAVIVEHGVTPNEDLFLGLRAASSNGGVVDIDALLTGSAQPSTGDGFALHRVGDAVASRGIAAAIYEARRLCQHM
jgi:NADPH-dependent 2,4-dienoyl-CoA reductase/sulfur reductase-like enzyme